jgi:[protein-PII] uridylyltransferase
VLYVALLLHDIAKGRRRTIRSPAPHRAAALPAARALAAETETVAWLVEHHLLMSMSRSRATSTTARPSSTSPRRAVIERLKLLLILTVCDIRAVGPGVWNGWKGQLLRTLYYETEPLLTGGLLAGLARARAAAAKAEQLASACRLAGPTRERYMARHYAAYWLRVDLPTRSPRRVLMREATGRRSSWRHGDRRAFEAVTEITVLAPDHPRLLSVSPAPARRPAPTSSTRRSSPPPTGSRSTPS